MHGCLNKAAEQQNKLLIIIIMATLTNEQIEQKKQQLKQLAEEAKQLKDELVEAGAWPMDEDDLDQAAGGGVPSYLQDRPIIPHGVL